jgi:primosomal protein N' (replication factor Y)
MKRLGLIVVDEEHDASFKQQDGFRYHARDLAIMRAKRSRVPIVLGSATPSLETYRHAIEGRYSLLRLPQRGPGQTLPAVSFVDLGREAARGGLSTRLLDAVRARLERHEQTLLFLNRRGYAPVLLCPECRWHAPCDRCDARLTVHTARQHLRCHHCGHERPIPSACPRCHHPKLLRVGEGTQRVEEMLRQALPTARVARIDRDTVSNRLALDGLLRKVREHEIDVLVGTQMMAKGHDFKDLTLVGVIQADQGLHGRDFRTDEQLFAQIVQVAGRAGRAAKPGEVIIQTYHPAHPLWAPLATLDYETFARLALKDRAETQFPPYTYCALLRAEALKEELPVRFLEAAKALGPESDQITLGSVLPATLARRAGYYRAQLLVTSLRRGALQAWLTEWIARFTESPAAAGVRWSLDVDPHSLF